MWTKQNDGRCLYQIKKPYMTSTAAPEIPLTRYAWLSIVAAILTITLKTAAYVLTGSVGLLSDALESTANLAAAIVALIALNIVTRPATTSTPLAIQKWSILPAASKVG